MFFGQSTQEEKTRVSYSGETTGRVGEALGSSEREAMGHVKRRLHLRRKRFLVVQICFVRDGRMGQMQSDRQIEREREEGD